MAIGTIGKYERLDVLGHGTSGVVYLAWDTLLRRQVALKEIRAAAPETERVLQEARVLDRLRHPHIVAVHTVDQENGAVLIDMELVRGQNLADLLRERSGEPLAVSEAGRIAQAVLDALTYAHERRIIHRDIKPANILVGRDGTIKLTDFGLAEALGSGSVAGGGGTYPYMAPEDFAEEESSDYRADLWAVGVVLYEMLTGRRPFAVNRSKDPFAWKRVIETEEPPPVTALRPELPAALDAVLARALAKNKGDRFPSARAFADALRAALGQHCPPDDRRPGSEERPRQEAMRPPPAGAPLAAAPAGGFRFAGGAAVARTLDELLALCVSHWEEARRALLDGRIERWLRDIEEPYIAELAGELTAREGEDADDLLREFLDRSGLDLVREARRREIQAEIHRRRGDAEAEAKQLAEARRLVPQIAPAGGRSAAPEARPGARFPTAVAERGTVAAVPLAAPALRVPAVPGPPRRVSSWWVWPLLAFCLAPPAGAVWGRVAGNDTGQEALLAAWVASGFLAALLLIVGLALRVPVAARVLCFAPLAGGGVAAGLLASTHLAAATPEALPLLAGLAALLLGILLLVSATAVRLWRLWAFLIVGAALTAAASFAGI